MRVFTGYDRRDVIMASDDELRQGYDFVAELGKPDQFGKDGFVLLDVTSGLLIGALQQEGFISKSSTANDLQAGQFNDKVTDAAFIIPHTGIAILLYFKAVSLDMYYPDLESDLKIFLGYPGPNTYLSQVGWWLSQIMQAFPTVFARDTDKFTFAEAIEILMQGAKWHVSMSQLEIKLSAHNEAILQAS